MICRSFKLTPILECVLPSGDGGFTAIFGYRNDEARTIVLHAGGADNFFRPAPRGRGQPTRFLPGRHRNVFSVRGTNDLFWSLGGRTVHARAGFAPCQTDFAGTDAPLALLPVRLETRFFPFGAAAPTELLVRIYPDDVHVDSHEPEINDDELAFGNAFWSDFSVPGNDPAADDQRRRAWAALADRFGPRRAAWIARVLAPGAGAPGQRDGSWTRAATTTLLPTRWVVLGYIAGKRVVAEWGKLLPTILQVGPSPHAAPDEAGVEPELKWLTDFDAAVDVGMAIRVPLTADTRGGFDRLLVLGSKGGFDRRSGAALFDAALEAHHYTDGLALIPQGTPTNNSDDQPSGYGSKDPGQARSFVAERGEKLFVPGDASDGDVLSALMGIDAKVLAHIDGAGGVDQRDAGAMNAVLWESTFGYFFRHMIAGTASPTEQAALRRHFIDNVRGRGPLPVLRIGRQPYGILPATSLNRWKPLEPGAMPSPSFANARQELLTLRGIWSDSVAGVPLVGAAIEDAEAALKRLVEALSMEPVSTSMEGRIVFTKRYVTAVNDYLALWFDTAISAIVRFFLELLGLERFDVGPQQYFDAVAQTIRGIVPTIKNGGHLLGVTYNVNAFALGYPLTGAAPPDLRQQPSGLVSETDPYAPGTNPFTAVRTLPVQDLRAFVWPDAAGITPLLPRIVRNAKLLEYSAISAALQIERGLRTPAELVEPAFVDLDPMTSSHTPGRIIDDQIPNLTAPNSVGAYLDGLTQPLADPRPSDPQLGNLIEFLDAAGYLENRPTAAIDRVFRELLDTASHRLDAWVTSLATSRLRALRAQRSDGLYLGGYGWVENLRPAARQTKPEGGFLLAPSLNHAAAAAILRNGRLSHNPEAVDKGFAIDLSSRRVRQARALVDGIRQGNSLAALLGYQFERGLKENHPGLFLESVLPDLRQLAPLAVNKIEDTASDVATTAVEDLGARNVIDGLRLRELYHAPAAGNVVLPILNALGATERAAVVAEIESLDDAVDALGDLALAEFVYQVARGNHARAAAALDAFGRAEAMPPEMQVVETPRSGVANTYRLLVLWSGAAAATPAGWGTGTPRALAEPQLNAWVAQLLGNPAAIQARVEFRDANNQPLSPALPNRKLSELAIAPLDALELARPGEAGSPSDLERLWANRLTLPAGASVRFDLGRDPGWGPETLSVGELFELARRIRELLGASRAATLSDLATPDDTPSGLDTTELGNRAQAAVTSLQTATNVLAAIDPDTSTLSAIRAALLPLVGFGVPGAVPALTIHVQPEDGEDPAATAAREESLNRAALKPQVPFVLKEAQRRLERHAALVAVFDPTDQPDEILVAQQLARLNTVFGAGFRALPRMRPSNATALAQAATLGDATEAANPFAALTWLQRMARLRDGATKLDDVLFYAETLSTGDALRPKILQLPAVASEPWIGLPLPAGQAAIAGRVSIVAHAPRALDFNQPLAGLAIDHWLDVIPNAQEIAGAAFQYDRPNSTAPQAILLAVTPVPQATWDLDSLEAVVLETIDLSRMRAVDPHTLKKIGQVLPALYFAHNLAHDTISLGTDQGP